MATNPQRFIQPMAQAASPFVPNNGNPNTVYNTTATPFGGQAAVAGPTGMPNAAEAWSDIAPFGGSNIRQVWSFAPASTTPPPSAFAEESRRFWENMTGMAPAQFSLANSGAVWPDGSNPFMPAQPQPVPGTGIEVPGDVDVDIHPHDPNFRPTPVDQGGGPKESVDNGRFLELTTGNSPGGIGTLPLNPNPGGSLPSNSPGWMRDMSGAISRGWDGLKDALGFRGDSISAMQVLDWFLPGDLVDANTGRINWDQAAKTAFNLLSPGLGSIIESAIDAGLLGSQLQDWLANVKFTRGAIEQTRQQGITIDEMQQALFDGFSTAMPTINFAPRDIPTGSVSIGPLTNPDTTPFAPGGVGGANPFQNNMPQGATGNTAIGSGSYTGDVVNMPAPAPVPLDGRRGALSANARTIATGADAQRMYEEMRSVKNMHKRLKAQEEEMMERYRNQMQ